MKNRWKWAGEEARASVRGLCTGLGERTVLVPVVTEVMDGMGKMGR